MNTKLFVDYPTAKTKQEVKDHFKKGGEVWQEISDEYPECSGWDSWEEINNELFYDVEDGEDISDYDIHLVMHGDETVNDDITSRVFDMLEEENSIKEIEKALNIHIEIDKDNTIMSITYPDGTSLSHWL